MKKDSKKFGEYMFLVGHHLNPDRELVLKIEPDDKSKNYIESFEVSLDEHEGVYNQDRLILLIKGEIKNGIELVNEQKEGIQEGARNIKVSGEGAILKFVRTPYLLHPIVIRATRGKSMEKGQRALYHISQVNKNGEIVGGVSVVFQGA